MWVVDTRPLIFMAKLDHLDLLRTSADTVCVAQAAVDEVRAKSDEATWAIDHACRTWLSVRQVLNRQAVELLLPNLGPGEAETIVLARELETDSVVMDDLNARRYARRLAGADDQVQIEAADDDLGSHPPSPCSAKPTR